MRSSRPGSRRLAARAAVGLCVALVMPLAPAAAGGDSLTITWAQGVSAPVRRSEAGSTVLGGRLYLFGGYFKGFVPGARVDRYDPIKRKWKRLPDLPEGLTHMGVATDGTYAYIAGGYLPKPGGGQIFATDHVWRFDPVALTFTAMPPLPSARGGGALVLLGRTLHYFGGSTIRRKDAGDHWTFDLDTDTAWQNAAPLPNPRNHIGGAQLGGLVYAVGGQHLQDTNAVPQDEVDAWDPATGQWTQVASLPTARSHVNGSTTPFAGRIVVVGGDPVPNQPTDEVDAYDPATNSWSVLAPLPVTVYASDADDVGGTLFSTAGAIPTKTALTYEATVS